jgi:aminoglycoside N3'-acetyltransferase
MDLKISFFKSKIKLVQLADIIINDMHITRNDIVMVHISLNSLNLIDSTPADLIYLLKMLVGSGGTLLMQTSSESYTNHKLVNQVPDALLRNELINELFRKMADTFQITDTAEKYAVWGGMAKNISEENNIIKKVNDKDNFFSKLCQMNAKIIGIGTPVSDLTLFYTEGGSKFFDGYELKVFKKRGIPFFWLSAEKVYNKILVLSKSGISG